MPVLHRLGRVLAAVLVGLAAPAAPAETAPPLRVLAAASLTETVNSLARGDPGVDVETGFGGSSALARQIRDGAPADVFVSASPDWIDFLRETGELAGEPVLIARNRIVCIAPQGSRLAARGARDARELLGRIRSGGRVGIADAGVPAGEYARSALRHLGLRAAFRPHLVGLRDVRAVLHAVEQGELDAGYVYATDARIADVAVLFVFAARTHPPIEIQAAVLRGAARPREARRFLDQLRGDAARARLAGAGFELP